MTDDNQNAPQQPFNENHQDQRFIDSNQGVQIWAETLDTSKSWKQSKTMWFNIGVTVIGVGTTLLPFAQPFIKPRTFGLLTTAIGIANMALRAATTDKINSND